CGFAIQYLIDHASDYNIDPKLILLSGGSAGAVISEYLTYGTDFPVAACVAIAQPYRFDEYAQSFHPRPVALYLLSTADTDDVVHHPQHAMMMAEFCRKHDIPVEIYGSGKNGLPKVPSSQPIIVYACDKTFARHLAQ
ncbi:MAG: hypothetical protein ACQKBW_10365, partial [Puniceicoccales bacterium]